LNPQLKPDFNFDSRILGCARAIHLVASTEINGGYWSSRVDLF